MFIFYIFSLALAVFAAWLYGRATDQVIAETNRETEIVRNENLKLRIDLDAEAGKVAGLQKAASDAVAEQQRVQTELERQRQRTANVESQNIHLRTDLETATAESRAKQAELAREQTKLAGEQRKTAEALRAADVARLALQKHLEEVAERQKPRHLTSAKRATLLSALKGGAGNRIRFKSVLGDAESHSFESEIESVFVEAGWVIVESSADAFFPQNPVGIEMRLTQ